MRAPAPLCILALCALAPPAFAGGKAKERPPRGWMDCRDSPKKHPGPWRPVKDSAEGAKLRRELAGRGRIAFASNRDGNWEIYAIDADGKNPVNLTKNVAWDFYPRWSPDGKRILFHSDRENKRKMGEFTDQLLFQNGPWDTSRFWAPLGGCYAEIGLYVMDADGSNVKRLQTGAINGVFSPDGKYIAYEANPKAQHTGPTAAATLYIMNLETGKVHLGTPPHWGGAWEPSFSEDGKSLLCMTGNDSGYSPTIFPLGAGYAPTGRYRVLCKGGEACRPRWAPGCKRVVYAQDTRGAKLRWVSLDEKGEGEHGFLPGKDIDLGIDDSKFISVCPTVSRDGRYLAFSQSPVYFEEKRKVEGLGYKHWNYGRQIIWQELCVARSDGKVFIQLTDGGYANRDPDWFGPK